MLANRILLIEDEVDLLDMFAEQLTADGYQVDKFADPIQACSHFEKNPIKYRLIISDLRMPSMTGLELIKKINKINIDVKIILMSAFEIDTFGSDLKEITIEGFLKKPMHLNQLLSMVESCVITSVIT